MAELAANALEGGAHLAGVFFVAKIVEGLVVERAGVRVRGRSAGADGKFEG